MNAITRAEMAEIDADQHRHATRARENGNMARRTATPQDKAPIAPVGCQKQ